MPFFDPLGKARCVTVAASAGAKRMSRNWKFADPWIRRRIERNNFHVMAAVGQNCGGLPDRLHRTADRRIKRVNGPKYFHPGSETVVSVLRSDPGPRCSID